MSRIGIHLPFWLHRLTAVLGVAWVLALGVLAVRPDWHEAVCHHHGHDVERAGDGIPCGDDAAGCIITHFAEGQLLATIAAPVLLFATAWRLLYVLAVPERVAVSLDRALPPGCGPPRS
jgi:hypothetical protein